MISRRTLLAAGSLIALQGNESLAQGLGSLFPSDTAEKRLEGNQIQGASTGRILTGFWGVRAEDPGVAAVANDISNGFIAGVILLERNIRSPSQLRELTGYLQSFSREKPIIICVDQEGGKVARIGAKQGFSEWISAGEAARAFGDEVEALRYYRDLSGELAASGVNLNLAPVVDLAKDKSSKIIYRLNRAYSDRAPEVISLARNFIKGHMYSGVKTCLKHFPGHGSVGGDTHVSPVTASDSWSADEVTPYTSLASEGLCEAVMTSHLLHEIFSSSPSTPVSLSPGAINWIRSIDGFSGVILTDDMQMGAITKTYSEVDAFLQAVRAGNDLFIYSNYRREDRELPERLHTVLLGAISSGEVSVANHMSAAERIGRYRLDLIS